MSGVVLASPATAHDLLALLRAHYLPPNRAPGGLFITEPQSPDGRRRADLLWIPTTIAEGSTTKIIGHELKVSRADVARELEEFEKAESWTRYCARWWLAVSDVGILNGFEIPEAWGIMAPPSGRRTRSMTIVRPAPKLTPAPLEPAWRTLVKWLGFRYRDAEHQRQVLQAENRNLGDRLSESRSHTSPEHVLRLARILEEVRRQTHGWGTPDDAAIIAALVDHAETTRICEEARRRTDTLIRDVSNLMRDPFRPGLLEQLQQMKRDAAVSA